MNIALLGSFVLFFLWSNFWGCDAYTSHHYLNFRQHRTYSHISFKRPQQNLDQRRFGYTCQERSSKIIEDNLDSLLLFSHVSSDGIIDVPSETLRRYYKILSIGYGLIATIFFLMPDKTFTVRLASKFGGAAGFGLAAGISRIMLASIHNNSLDSETCKRLNVGLLGFSVLGLFSVPGEAAFLFNTGPVMFLTAVANITRLFGAVVAYTGWSHGVLKTSPVRNNAAMLLSPKEAVIELFRGTKATFVGMKVLKVNKKKSLMYRNSVLIILLGMFSSFMEGLFHVRVGTVVGFVAVFLLSGK